MLKDKLYISQSFKSIITIAIPVAEGRSVTLWMGWWEVVYFDKEKLNIDGIEKLASKVCKHGSGDVLVRHDFCLLIPSYMVMMGVEETLSGNRIVWESFEPKVVGLFA